MPVTRTFLLLASALVVAALIAPVAGEAKVRVIVRYASQLADDPAVHKNEVLYKYLSGMNVIYAQCDQQWQFSPEQKKYLSDKFTSVSKDYLKSFEEAYQARFYAPSPQALVDDYVKTMTTQQQNAVNTMAEDLAHNKCKGQNLKNMLQDFDMMRLQDAAKAAEVPAKPTEIIPTMPANRQAPGVIPSSTGPAEEPPLPEDADQK